MASTTQELQEQQQQTATFSHLHVDTIRTHILPHLDGCTLAAVGCTTPELRSLSSDQSLWSHICHSTWPSTTVPRLRHVISSFPGGPRSFFSLSYPLFPTCNHNTMCRKETGTSFWDGRSNNYSPTLSPFPEKLISAVDIFYRGKSIFSRVQETETVTGWFRCSPFRVDMVGPKESVTTPIRRPSHEDTCRTLINELELSWIVVDPVGQRAVNVSSFRAVSLERHWLSREVHVRFASVAGGGHVMCCVDVTCVGGSGPTMHVTEVSLKMEDIDGVHLNGRDSLVILEGGFEGKSVNDTAKGGRRREEEGRTRYMEFLERKRERRESVLRREGRLDMMCAVLGAFIFVALFFLICCSR